MIINNYPNQGYKTIFNQVNGFLLRIENKSGVDPFWCEQGPELIDISITNWCDKSCGFCYRSSSPSGKHMSIQKYREIMEQANNLNVLQVALGGGNPNQHPDFCEILEITRQKYNVIPSYTTNGRGLTKEVLRTSSRYCGAVAVSFYKPIKETINAIHLLQDQGIRTNIHFLLTSNSIEYATNLLKRPPDYITRANAIIFLNYKPVGYMPDMSLLIKNTKELSSFFKLAQEKYPFKIGFDSCSISGISRFMNISPIFVERCEASRFSMFISENMKMYPCSFLVNRIKGIPLTSTNMQDIWKNSNLFTGFRKILGTNNCPNCSYSKTCYGGCPVFKEINVCN